MHVTKLKAGERLDALVVQHIMGDKKPGPKWSPSQDEAAAMEAANKLRADNFESVIDIGECADKRFRCSIRLTTNGPWRVAYAATKPLAICGALLQAAGVKEVTP